MSTETELASYYRTRAKELRTIADAETDAKTRIHLESLAYDYDRIAESLEAIHETNESVRKTETSHLQVLAA